MKKASSIQIIIASLIIGGIITWGAISMQSAENRTPEAAITPEYGELIIRNTALYLGTGQNDPQKQLSGTNMACASCHLESGRLPGTLSLLDADSKYPRFSGRDGGDRDLQDRINGCMQRSMNGSPLPRDSVEILAMVSYIEQLNDEYQAMSSVSLNPQEPDSFSEPQRRASIENGLVVFNERCQICHGSNGEGLLATGDHEDGYLFPPLWGEDSYNNGAGMTRLLTAARFIKARMPLGQPDLTDDEAYDVAAYINSHERPVKSNLEADYPELFRKPVDSPYPPYADPFPQEQHQLGPFQPIRDYYESLPE